MVLVEGNQDPIVTNFVGWFDRAWLEATHCTNEPYRFEACDRLWGYCSIKAQSEPAIRKWMDRLASSGIPSNPQECPNLILPSVFPEISGRLVDLMASAVSFRGTNKTLLTCEIREPGEDWEGLGKSSTYLDLVGIRGEICGADRQELEPCSTELELLDAVNNSTTCVGWEETAARCGAQLIAADFLWLWCEGGILNICPPEGECGWGLWDCARQLLRRYIRSIPKGFQRQPLGHAIQKEIFFKLPFQPLADRYGSIGTAVSPSGIVILRPISTEPTSEPTVERIADIERGRRLLESAIQSAPLHYAPFWQGNDRVFRGTTLLHMTSSPLFNAYRLRSTLQALFLSGLCNNLSPQTYCLPSKFWLDVVASGSVVIRQNRVR